MDSLLTGSKSAKMPLMIDEMRTPEKEIRRRARGLTRRVHPDNLQAISIEAAKQSEALIPLLEKIIKNPIDMENWGDDIRNQYPHKGLEITFIGLAPDRTLRPPRPVALRKPSVFLDMLGAYLDTGDIPQYLLDAPAYDPSYIDEDEDWGVEDPEAIARENARVLIEGIQTAKDFDHCMGLKLATQISPQHNMRMFGVLKALDEKVQEIITKEIEAVDDLEKLKTAEEHILEFQFDDTEISPRLTNLFEERRRSPLLPPEPVYAPPSELEIRASEASSLETLRAIVAEVEEKRFDSEQERVNTRKSINTYAKKALLNECGMNASLEAFAKTFREAQEFPFSDEAYGFHVLDMIEMRAKYFVLGTILNSPSIESLDAIAPTIDRFPFRHPENGHDLRMEIERHRRFMYSRRSKSGKSQ